jgi:putative addiction module component (TIGR02574 family)
VPKTVDELFAEALQLSEEDREILADKLLDSVATDEERAQHAEWERRVAEVEAGTAKLIPADEVIRKLKAKYLADDRRSR